MTDRDALTFDDLVISMSMIPRPAFVRIIVGAPAFESRDKAVGYQEERVIFLPRALWQFALREAKAPSAGDPVEVISVRGIPVEHFGDREDHPAIMARAVSRLMLAPVFP